MDSKGTSVVNGDGTIVMQFSSGGGGKTVTIRIAKVRLLSMAMVQWSCNLVLVGEAKHEEWEIQDDREMRECL